jgi:hypothetical protein
MPPSDMTGKFNTPLTKPDEAAFQAWLRANKREGDLRDYDMRGAWKENAKQANNGHFPDEFKKPNHPTFSDESKYNRVSGFKGGSWAGDDKRGWEFRASEDNLRNMTPAELQQYFKQVEPDARLVIPKPPSEILYPKRAAK